MGLGPFFYGCSKTTKKLYLWAIIKYDFEKEE